MKRLTVPPCNGINKQRGNEEPRVSGHGNLERLIIESPSFLHPPSQSNYQLIKRCEPRPFSFFSSVAFFLSLLFFFLFFFSLLHTISEGVPWKAASSIPLLVILPSWLSTASNRGRLSFPKHDDRVARSKRKKKERWRRHHAHLDPAQFLLRPDN